MMRFSAQSPRSLLSTALGAAILMVTAGGAVASVCRDLENELAEVQRPAPMNDRATVRRLNQLANEVNSLQDQARAHGCATRNSLQRPAGCRTMLSTINGLRNEYGRLMDQRSGSLRRDPGRERRILAALGANNCGPRYAAYAPQPQQRADGLLTALFGNTTGREQHDAAPQQRQTSNNHLRVQPRRERATRSEVRRTPMGTYRTVCVRACDGFYWPVSFSTTPGNFANDINVCQASCPGTEVALYAQPAPFGTPEDMTAVDTGQPYSALDNALRFQREVVSGCGCPTATEIRARLQAEASIPLVVLEAGGTLEDGTIASPRPNPLWLEQREADRAARAARSDDADPGDIRIVGPVTPVLVR